MTSFIQNAIYLSLGSNLGDRLQNLRSAIERLSRFCKLEKISSCYETEPVEFTAQPWFLNCVVEIAAVLTAEELLRKILQVEEEMGRKRILRKGPRVIDIDILIFGDLVMQKPGLTIPHPEMHLRRFVLAPLVEVAPVGFHPALKRSVRDLLDSLKDASAIRFCGRELELEPNRR